MTSSNRRLVNGNLQPKLPPSPAPQLTEPTEAAAAATQFDSSSMAVTALVLLSALFFLSFFSIYARRFFSESSRGGGVSSANFFRRPFRSLGRGRFSSGSAGRGLDPSVVRALPLSRYAGGNTGKEGSQWCVVCLNEFEEKETVKVIPGCGHVFHPRCIDAWLVARASCPLCRCSEMVGWRRSRDREEASLDVVVMGEGEEREEGENGNSDNSGGGGGGGRGGGGDGFGLFGVEPQRGVEIEERKVVSLGRSGSWSWRDEEETTVFLRRTCSF